MKVRVSVIVPVFNEVKNVDPLCEALFVALTKMDCTYEIVFIDDGSTDGTLAALRQLQQYNPSIRVLCFRKNFGQTAAMRAGFQAARGSIIVTMDGDMQNDPADIPLLVAKIEEGNDLVIGWRKDRKDPAWTRTVPSRIANWLISRMTGVLVHDSGCSLKAYRGSMIKKVPLYSEMHRFIPAMSTLHSTRIAEVVVRHHPRRFGESKYGLSRIWKVLLDVIAIKMLISFRFRPLQYFSGMAIPFFGLALVSGSTYALARMTGSTAIVVSSIAFLLFSYLTVHFFFVGLLSELVVRAGQREALPKARVEYVDA